jgi:outer membrane immunogenic protein
LGGNAGFGSSSWTYSNPTDNPTVPGERGIIVGNDFVVGAQVGCDYEAAGVVIGAQGSLDWTQMKGRFFDSVEIFFDEQAQANWFATATGRIGVAMTPQALFYAKGGAAWINNHYNDIIAPFNFVDGSATGTRLGWTAGAGVEYMFAPNWSVFLEYNYMSFGNSTETFSTTPPFSFQINQHVQTIVLGLNLRFNFASAAPVAVRY